MEVTARRYMSKIPHSLSHMQTVNTSDTDNTHAMADESSKAHQRSPRSPGKAVTLRIKGSRNTQFKGSLYVHKHAKQTVFVGLGHGRSSSANFALHLALLENSPASQDLPSPEV